MSAPVLDRFEVEENQFPLATVHRAENTDDPVLLRTITENLDALAATGPVVYPVHPRTRNAMDRDGLNHARAAGVRIVEPLGYMDITVLEKAARVVRTDSGGRLKEAFFHGTPCVRRNRVDGAC